MEDYKFIFKVVLVGNAGVGKTCLVRRFTQGLFPPGQGTTTTIGVDFMVKTMDVNGEKVKLQIWDTAGQERFRSITQSYYRSAQALILVYDVSSQPTYDCLPDWLRDIEEYANSKVLRVLVGNRSDREDRVVPTHVGEDFAQRNNLYFMETSSKEGTNVEKLFMEIAHSLIERIPELEEEEEVPVCEDYSGVTELSVSSVIAMAETVGVELDKDVASALGDLSLWRLRSAMKLALQLSDHELSPGLRVIDFSRAEIMLNVPTFGHKSNSPAPQLKPIEGDKITAVCEGPKIDLRATLGSPRISEFVVEDLDPTFYKQCICFGRLDNSEYEDCKAEDISSFLHEEDDLSAENVQVPLHLFSDFNKYKDREAANEEGSGKSCGSTIPNYINYKDYSSFSQVNQEEMDLADFEFEDQITRDIVRLMISLTREGCSLNTSSLKKGHDKPLDRLWIEYIECFVTSFFAGVATIDSDQACDQSRDEEFDKLVKDMVEYGAVPVLGIVCDLFRDYAKGFLIPVSVKGIRRVISVVNAFVIGPSRLSILQLSKLSAVLIELLILPPPFEVQLYLTHVFMQVLRKFDELLTWTCTYITEVLKKSKEIPLESFGEPYKSVLHGALCLVNGLESLKIQVAQEFGWHESIISLSKKFAQEVYDDTDLNCTDGFIEEEVLKFFRHFLINYTRLVTAGEMEIFHQSIRDVYGEKLIPFLCCLDNFSSHNLTRSPYSLTKQHSSVKVQTSEKNKKVLERKGYYKNKKVKISFKSFVTSAS